LTVSHCCALRAAYCRPSCILILSVLCRQARLCDSPLLPLSAPWYIHPRRSRSAPVQDCVRFGFIVGNIDASDDYPISSLYTLVLLFSICRCCPRLEPPLLVSTWRKSTTFAPKTKRHRKADVIPKTSSVNASGIQRSKFSSRDSCSASGLRLSILGPVGILSISSALFRLVNWKHSTRSLHRDKTLETHLLTRRPLEYRRPDLRSSTKHLEVTIQL